MIADWPSQAACRTGDPDALFVQGAEQNVAKRICRGCPVRYECLADALDNRIEFGVWGGMQVGQSLHRIGEGLFIDLGVFRPDPVTDGAVAESSKFETHDATPNS